MSNFAEKNIELGNVLSFQKLTPKFEVVSDKKVVDVRVDCSCLKPTFKDKEVVVNYTTTDFPKHLSMSGVTSLVQRKFAKVYFDDDSMEEISFRFKLKCKRK